MSQETILAEVCGDKITLREVDLKLREVLRNRNVPRQAIQNYIPDFVNQFVAERASACFADEMGFRVSDEEVANAIKSMLPQIFGGGFNKPLYQRFLQEQNLTVPEFEANVRKQMQRVQLVNVAAEGVVVGPNEVEQEFRRRNEKIRIEYVSFNPDKFKGQVKLSDQDLEAFFKANTGRWSIPEKRSFDFIVASEERMGAQLEVTDTVLRQIYSSSIDRYRSGDQVNLRQILLTTTGKSADDAKKLEAKANELLKQLKAGADFAKLAKENSDDPGTKDKGGEFGWVTKGQIPDKDFENAAFSTKKGELSNVVKSSVGFHVLQIVDRKDATVKPFDEVRAELATEYKNNAGRQRMESVMDQARAELLKNPRNAAAIAAKAGLSHYSVQDAAPNTPLQEIGVVAEFEGAIQSLQAGGVTAVMVTPGNKLAVGTVTAVTPARPALLSEVEAQVREAAIQQKAQEMAMQKQIEISNQVKGGADLKAIAKAVGGEVKTSDFFTRDGAVEGVGSGAQFGELFAKEPGALAGPFNIADSVVVARLESKQPADLGKLAAERENLVAAIKQRKAQERVDLFDDGLVARMIDRGKVKLDRDAIRRLIEANRG
jgi:peptidyl-prolyl cis-trans isomerase D